MASGSGDEEGNTEGVSWRLIAPASELSNKPCRLMHSSLGRDSDVCLFYVKGEFFAMDARCSHAGGPLCEGDIEEADGVLQVFCPWHDYNFDLRTGKSGTSLTSAYTRWVTSHTEMILSTNQRTAVHSLNVLGPFGMAWYPNDRQQVYEVKLEDGNLYVKHVGSLSLKPFPADQKS